MTRRLRARLTWIVALVLPTVFGGTAWADALPAAGDGEAPPHLPEFVVLPPSPGQAGSSVVDPPRPFPSGAGANGGKLEAAYTARVPDAAKAAIESALDRWAAVLRIAVPVQVDIDWLPSVGDTLVGAAKPTLAYANFAGAPEVGTFYPVALANQLAGADQAPAESDIDIVLAERSDWDYATTGPISANRVSLAAVVLHEVLHGLGFNTALQVDVAGIGASVAPNAASTIFDRFLVDRDGTFLSTLPNASVALGTALTQGLFWRGARGAAANGGAPPVLYSPFPFQPASSIAHLDELTYPAGHPDAVSTPLLIGNEAVSSVGTIAPAMLADMGWVLETTPSSPSDPVPAQPDLPTPATPPVSVPVSAPLPGPGPSPTPSPTAPTPTVPLSGPLPDAGADPVGSPSDPVVVPPGSSPTSPTPAGSLPRTGFPTSQAGMLGGIAVAAGSALVRRSRWSRPVSRVRTPAP